MERLKQHQKADGKILWKEATFALVLVYPNNLTTFTLK